MLSELTSLSDLPDVDFSKLATLARSIEEKSSLVGAEHVRSACADLIQACERMHKQNFLRALGWIKNEFAHTRNKLDSFVQMERRIFRVEGREVK
ncbi:PREDICTED: histidine-containing phosphotransfer protein 1-like isoform X2 [Prunus mume]|nr:PREDICTED: histidine-containing phosphotransfer protein 1-like isoform X2 [Prunus mume]